MERRLALLMVLVTLLAGMLPASNFAAAAGSSPAADPTAIDQDLLVVAGYDGQYSGSTTVALPLVARSDLQTTLFLQNTAPSPTDAAVQFYDLDGNLVTDYTFGSIPAFSSVTLEQAAMGLLPDGFEGSAAVMSTGPVLAVVNVEPVGAASLLSYEGAPEGATALILPSVMRSWYGFETDFWVQNTSTSPAEVTITYSPYGTGTPYMVADTIPAKGTRIYRQAEMPQLGDSFYGYARIEANQPVAAVVEMWGPERGRASAYRGISLSGTVAGFASPRQTKSAWSSSTLILNLGAADAQVQANWYGADGSSTWIESPTLAPGAKIEHYLPAMSGIPADFDGSLLVSANQLLAGLVNWSNPAATGDDLATQSGLPWEAVQSGSRLLAYMAFLPRVAHDASAGTSTEFSIQNLSAFEANVALTFYDQTGASYAVGPDSIPGYGILRYTTDDQTWMPDGWQGAVVVASIEPVAIEAIQFLHRSPPAEPDLALSKTDDLDPVTLDEVLTYEITVSNEGPGTATGVTVEDTLPAGLTFGTVTPSQGSCTGTSVLTCNLGTLASSASATVTVVTTPTVEGSITNTVTVTGNEPDPDPADNTATEGTVVVAGASTVVEPGSDATLTYTDSQGNPTTIDVPGDAVDETTKLVFAPLETLPTAVSQRTGSPPSVYARHGFDLRAYYETTLQPKLVFSRSVSTTIHYSNEDVAGIDEESLELLCWDGVSWQDQGWGPYERDPDSNRVLVPMNSVGRCGLFGRGKYRFYLPLLLKNR